MFVKDEESTTNETSKRAGDDGIKSTTLEEVGISEKLGENQEKSKEGSEITPKTPQSVVTEEQKEDSVKEYISTAIQEDIIAYNGYELKRKYPKAMAAMKLYMEDKAQAPLEEDVFMGVLLYSSRTVFFGYFDHKKLFVNILGYDNKWYYTLERITQSTKDYPNRVECEVEAFIAAFAELEKQLNLKP